MKYYIHSVSRQLNTVLRISIRIPRCEERNAFREHAWMKGERGVTGRASQNRSQKHPQHVTSLALVGTWRSLSLSHTYCTAERGEHSLLEDHRRIKSTTAKLAPSSCKSSLECSTVVAMDGKAGKQQSKSGGGNGQGLRDPSSRVLCSYRQSSTARRIHLISGAAAAAIN